MPLNASESPDVSGYQGSWDIGSSTQCQHGFHPSVLGTAELRSRNLSGHIKCIQTKHSKAYGSNCQGSRELRFQFADITSVKSRGQPCRLVVIPNDWEAWNDECLWLSPSSVYHSWKTTAIAVKRLGNSFDWKSAFIILSLTESYTLKAIETCLFTNTRETHCQLLVFFHASRQKRIKHNWCYLFTYGKPLSDLIFKDSKSYKWNPLITMVSPHGWLSGVRKRK